MKEVIDEDINKAMTQFELMNGVRAESKQRFQLKEVIDKDLKPGEVVFEAEKQLDPF